MSEGKEVFMVVSALNDRIAGVLVDVAEVFDDEPTAMRRKNELKKEFEKDPHALVVFRKVKIQSSSAPQKSLSDLQTISQKMQEKEKTAKTNISDDPMNPDWPFGFDCFGKAITMREMLEDPDSALNPSFLEPSDQWKVVKARIKRYKNNRINVAGFGYGDRAAILDHVSRKTASGEQIRDDMINWLQNQMNLALEKQIIKQNSIAPQLWEAIMDSENWNDFHEGSWD